MASKTDQILEHIIDIKTEQGATNQHLKNLNGSILRHEKELAIIHKRVTRIDRRANRNSGKLIILVSIVTLILTIIGGIFRDNLLKMI